jgi:hypothetical protein
VFLATIGIGLHSRVEPTSMNWSPMKIQRTKRDRRLLFVSTIAIMSSATAACSGSKPAAKSSEATAETTEAAAETTSTETTPETSTETTTEATTRGALGRQFSAIPLSAVQGDDFVLNGFAVDWFDVLRISEASGLVRPEALADRSPWQSQLFEAGGFLPRWMIAVPPEDFESTVKEIGIHPLAITSALEIQRPPTVVTLLNGEFSAKELTAAMGEPKEGMWSVGPEEDFVPNIGEVTRVRELGQGLRFTASDAGVLMSTNTDIARESAKAPTGRMSMLDDQRVGVVAQELDRANVYAARAQFGLSSGPTADRFQSFDSKVAEAKQDMQDPLKLFPFLAMAVGASSKTSTTLIFVSPNEEAAAKNEPILKRVLSEGISEQSNEPLSTYFSVESVARNGVAIVATIRPVPGREMWAFQAVGSGDLPFRSGPVSRALKPKP